MPEIPPLSTADALLQVRRSCWRFLETCVWTLDQADRWNPIKQYPHTLPYLKPLVELVVNDPLTAIVKHRRMVISWTMCAIAVWDALFHEGRHIAMVSKKEEDSDELVQRCRFIYEHIPSSALPVKPKGSYKYTEFRIDEIDSKIKAYAQGPDQLRQYTCSRVICDEIAFWPHGRATFVGLKPTIEGGGKVTLLSTRFPGFFQEVVEDRLDAA